MSADEVALGESEERSASPSIWETDVSLVDSFVVPASLHDVDGRFIHVNAAAERASGKTNAWWLGRHFTEPLSPAEREVVVARFRSAVEGGEPSEFETEFVDVDGRLRRVRALYVPLASRNTIVGILILAFDVAHSAPKSLAVPRAPRLTPRQAQVLDLIAAGFSTSEIAMELTLSIETVRNYIRNLLRELQVHTRVEAIAAARRHGLLSSSGLRPDEPPAAGTVARAGLSKGQAGDS